MRRLLILLAAPGLLAPQVLAQFKFREPPNRQDPAALSQLSGESVWQQFLLNRAVGRFTIEGTLVHRPARQASRSYALVLEGDWSAAGERTRVLLRDDSGAAAARDILVAADGSATSGSAATAGAPREPLPASALKEPFIDGLPFTWNDLLMPWLRWSNVSYLGPTRVLGRPAHRFGIEPAARDNASAFPARAVVTLDEDYAALLQAELLDRDGALVQRVRVAGFRQFSGRWMFSELVWEHRARRDSVRLAVRDFAAR